MIKAVRRGSLSFSLFVVASAACVYEQEWGCWACCTLKGAPQNFSVFLLHLYMFSR